MTFSEIRGDLIRNLTQTQSHNHYCNNFNHLNPNFHYFDHCPQETGSSFAVFNWMFLSLYSKILPFFVASILYKSLQIIPMMTLLIPQRSNFFYHSIHWYQYSRPYLILTAVYGSNIAYFNLLMVFISRYCIPAKRWSLQLTWHGYLAKSRAVGLKHRIVSLCWKWFSKVLYSGTRRTS